MADDNNRIVLNRYELQSQIARGGTARVYLAKDLKLDRKVAVKMLFPELSVDSSFVERFRRVWERRSEPFDQTNQPLCSSNEES